MQHLLPETGLSQKVLAKEIGMWTSKTDASFHNGNNVPNLEKERSFCFTITSYQILLIFYDAQVI